MIGDLIACLVLIALISAIQYKSGEKSQRVTVDVTKQYYFGKDLMPVEDLANILRGLHEEGKDLTPLRELFKEIEAEEEAAKRTMTLQEAAKSAVAVPKSRRFVIAIQRSENSDIETYEGVEMVQTDVDGYQVYIDYDAPAPIYDHVDSMQNLRRIAKSHYYAYHIEYIDPVPPVAVLFYAPGQPSTSDEPATTPED